MSMLIEPPSTRQAFYALQEALTVLWSGSPSSQVIVLRGATGSGRTAVLQGLYEMAAASQRGSQYWPASIRGDLTDPSVARDLLYPGDFEVGAGARLPYLWWALSGRDEEALGRADHQLRVHAESFGAALAHLDELTKRRIAVAADAVFLLGGLIPVVRLVVEVLDALATGVKVGLEAPRLAVRRQSQIEAALTASEDRRFSLRPDFEAQAESDGRLLVELSSRVPLLVSVDDADGLDETAISLLNTLVRSARGRVLLVLTINTDHHPTRPVVPPMELGDVYNPDLHRFLAGLKTPGMLRVVDLDPWTPEQLTDLARIIVTAMDREQPRVWSAAALATLVSAAGGAPGRLVTLLEHRSIRAATRRESALPPDLVGFTTRLGNLVERWATLVPAQRWALANLALHGPRTLEVLIDASDLQTALTSRWVRALPGVHPRDRVVEFVSPGAYAAARAGMSSEFSAEQATSSRRRLADRLTELTPQWPALPIYVLDSLLTELVRASDLELPPATIAAHLRLRRATGREAQTTAFLETILQRARTPVGELLVATAEGLADAGYTFRAIDAFTQALDRLTSKYGPGSPQTLPTLHNLASAWVAHANSLPPDQREVAYERAAGLLEKLVAGWVHHQGAEQVVKTLPDARFQLAELYARQLHRFRSAIQHGVQCVLELSACADYGPLHPKTLASRHNLARAYELDGDLGEAIPLYERTLSDRVRVLGSDHPDTLNARNSLAVAYWSDGNLGQAIPLLKRSLSDRVRVLGSDHPHALSSRHNLACAYRSSGDLGQAMPLFQRAMDGYVRVLGSDHPDTLACRHSLAYAYTSVGDLDRAIPLYERTLSDHVRVLGSVHPDTLSSRHNLACAYTSDGALGRAIPLFDKTLDDYVRVLGSDHPHTMSCRNNLAYACMLVGDLDRAVTLFEQVLSDRVRVLGSDHPDALDSRNNLQHVMQQVPRDPADQET